MESTHSIDCFKCGKLLPERAKFCGACRTQIKCKECDATLDKGDEFCVECGAEVVALNNSAKDGHFNTISIHETATERNIEAKFSNEVGKDLTGILRDAMMGNKSGIGSPKSSTIPADVVEDADFQELPAEKESIEAVKIPAENTSNNTDLPIQTEYPAIINISMKALPASETEWVLIYSFYASKFGTEIFTRQDVINKYEESNRRKRERLNSLTGNFRTLIKSGKISALTNGYSILEPGINLAKEIILRTKSSIVHTKTKKVKDNSSEEGETENSNDKKKTGGNATRSKRLNDIDFHPEGKDNLETFFKKYSPKNDYERILLFVYYMKKVIEIDSVSYNHIFTCFETLDLKTPLNVPQITRNSASEKGWLDLADSKKIEVTTNGKNKIRKWNENGK